MEVNFPNIKDITKALETIRQVVEETPLSQSIRYSNDYDATILLKREDYNVYVRIRLEGLLIK